jgi:two-component system alkaline phosphatase synthesis response regulator PhoP
MNRMKILLVSADISVINSVTSCLEDAGYEVIHSHLGAGALGLIQAERPALVILDWELPDFNSLAIIRALREEQTENIPVILMGAKISEEDVLIGLEIGADLCLVEIFYPQVFVARVRALLRRSELLKSL